MVFSKLRNSRKAMSGPLMTLIAIIMVVLIIILLAVIFKNISDASEEQAKKSRCKSSVAAYARLLAMPDVPFVDEGTTSSAKIHCPTEYIIIDDAEPNQMRREVANLLVDCWDNFGEGKLKLFRAEDEKFCVICSVFQFEDRSVRLTGLPSFLMMEKAPVIRDGIHPNYQEFLTGVRTSDQLAEQARGTIDENYFDGSKRYAVMFTYYKESYWSQLEGAGFFGAIGAGLGIVAGIAISVATGGAAAPLSAMIIGASVGALAGGTAGAAATGGGQGASFASGGADWDAQVVMSEYDAESLRGFGCDSLPVSQIDEEFK